MKFYNKNKSIFPIILLILTFSGCQSVVNHTDSASTPTSQNPIQRISELQIVDCSLPGQMRMIGSRTYMTPRRATRTTASDCSILGGEFVAYDRANYKTALSVWMPEAESGDAEAQANVGEIFEKGLGGTPNYAAAIIWYKKAAEQGNKKAQFNLGTLYEQGLGVPKDMIIALNWYRQAWGVPADELMFKTVLEDEKAKLTLEQAQKQDALKLELDKKLARKDRQINLLERQIGLIASQVSKQTNNNETLAKEVEELNFMVSDLKKERQITKTESATLSEKIKLRRPVSSIAKSPRSFDIDMPLSATNLSEHSFGRYYALVIGNQRYQNIDDLDTPVNDADKIADVLETKYGFTVFRLNDSDNIAIMDAINNLNEIVKEEDNLLIYYAGHGNRVRTGEFETGYWLPTNADAPPRDTLWISNEFVTRHIARIPAKRVMVIADSCYAGLLSSAPGFLMINKLGRPNTKYIEYKKPRRSRLLLTSGGDKPVLDGGGGDYSVFANALIGVLEGNDRLLTGPELFTSVKKKVVTDSVLASFPQTPEYKVIKGAGHEMGDFFFIPKKSSGT